MFRAGQRYLREVERVDVVLDISVETFHDPSGLAGYFDLKALGGWGQTNNPITPH